MQSIQPNSTLQGGKYKILSVLGQGGFGITYLAEHTLLGRKVAVKEFFMRGLCERDEGTSHVTIGTSAGRDMVDRFSKKFLKEARNIASLDHPNIVRIFDVFEENCTAYYVMDYIGGGSLSEKVKREGPMCEEIATRYILQVADALEYIHSRSMNHLDVKPANIVLRENTGSAVLIDFGLSKQYDAAGEQTSTSPVGISDGYAPLEQYRLGGVGAFSPQTDIYSLGATFYYLLTGQTPPSASDVNEDGVPVEKLQAKGVSPKAIDVICWAMKSSRKARLQNIRSFREQIAAPSDTSKLEEPLIVTPLDPNPTNQEDTLIVASVVPHLENEQRFTVNDVPFKMMRVEGGTFTMGATSEQGSEAYGDENPIHQVTLSSYYIGETAVTQELWEAVMGCNPSRFKGKRRPVECVTWNDCQDFIRKLNIATGMTFRLPTEAEGEYAARGGARGKGSKFSGSNNLEDVAWFAKNSWGKGPSSPEYGTHNVATKLSNELGLYDMSGNVCEWCQDWYDSYSNSPQTNPQGPEKGKNRVYRGGGWRYSFGYCRTSRRGCCTPGDKDDDLGLRLALSE